MELEEKPRSRKRSITKGKFVGIVVCGVVAVIAVFLGIYVQIGQKYKTVFFPNTIMNGIDVSEKTVDEVKALISLGIDGYTLTIEERGGAAEEIKGDDISLHAVFDGSLEQMMEEQRPNEWFLHITKSRTYQIETMIVYAEDQLEKKVSELQCLDETKMISPQNASVSDYVPGQGYVVIPETEGTEVFADRVIQGISEAILNLQPKLSLEDLDSYKKAEITKEEEQLIKLTEKLNRYTDMTVTYQFGDKKEVLNGDVIEQWVSVTPDAEVAISAEGVADYVKELAYKYNTVHQAKNLKTSYGTTVKINGGNYGWKIDEKAETEELFSLINAGESQIREPIYSQQAAGHGDYDYGDTYVEINLTAQHLYFYKEGKLLVESDFVSGNLARGHETPPGSFRLTYKEKNAILKGENYRTPVSYWMPFNRGIGMHDAKWRSSFGGNIYKTGGSHGCINLPPRVAKTIFENITPGTAVLCYYLEGTEKAASQAPPKEPAAAPTNPVAPTDPAVLPTETSPNASGGAIVIPVETTAANTQAPGTPSAPDGSNSLGPGADLPDGTTSENIGPGSR